MLEGIDPKQLRGLVDEAKQRVGSGVVALVAVNDGRASVAVGVTDDLTSRFNAVDLVREAVAALGGQGGGGRPDMAQGGGPDGGKAAEAVAGGARRRLAETSRGISRVSGRSRLGRGRLPAEHAPAAIVVRAIAAPRP